MTELEEAWRELDDDPAVRVIVNTGNGRNFQTGLDVAALSRDKEAMTEQSRRTRDAELRFTAWHNQVWTPVIAAVNGSCAGGGLHFVADADIVIAASDATFFDTHVSLGQAMSYEGVGLSHKMAFEPIMRMALVGRSERMPATRARQLGMISQIVDPPEGLRDAAAGAGREGRQELACGDARHQEGVVGRARARAHRRVPRRGAGARRRVGTPRPDRRPARVLREARRPNGRQLGWRSRVDVLEVRHLDRGAPRAGRLADQQPARPAQRDERPHARRVRRRVARARCRSRGQGDRAHRRGARLPDRRRRAGARHRRHGHGALPRVGRELGPPLHRVAAGRREAGDHRDQRHLRRRRVPLGGRGRHRDRGERRAVLRPAHVGRSGRRHRGHRVAAQDAVRGGDAHGAGGSLRAHERRARLRARHDLADRRSAREAARGRAGAGRDDRQELARGDARHQEGVVGCARARTHRRVPGRCAGAGLDVGPPRPDRGPAGVRREARAQLGP